jgi:hypothetical protein
LIPKTNQGGLKSPLFFVVFFSRKATKTQRKKLNPSVKHTLRPFAVKEKNTSRRAAEK